MATRSMLAAVHVAKKELGLDDDAYRDVLRRVANVDSAAKLDDGAANRVMDEFRRLGFSRVRARKADPRGAATTGAQRLIKALWIGLAQLGVLRDPSDAALGAWIKRQGGPELLRFVGPGDARRLIEALKAWLEREGVDFSVAWDGERLDPIKGRAAILLAQWDKLRRLGVVYAPHPANMLMSKRLVSCQNHDYWTAAEGDAAIRFIGDLLRDATAAEKPS